MKRLISAVMVVALLVSVAPAVAGDSFRALSQLPASLTPLDDAQLATIEGGNGSTDVCLYCWNYAYVDVYQSIKIIDSDVSESQGGDLTISNTSTVTINQYNN